MDLTDLTASELCALSEVPVPVEDGVGLENLSSFAFFLVSRVSLSLVAFSKVFSIMAWWLPTISGWMV